MPPAARTRTPAPAAAAAAALAIALLVGCPAPGGAARMLGKVAAKAPLHTAVVPEEHGGREGRAALGARPAPRNATSGATVLPVRGGSKTITFIRHGLSVANARLKGAWWSGSALAWRDSVLMPKGEEQVWRRVAAMSEATLQRILDAELVMVSPLRRTLGTAVLTLAHARHRQLQLHSLAAAAGECNEEGGLRLPEGSGWHWPRVRITAELRECIKSDSERPGTNQGGEAAAEAYVQELAGALGQKLFCNEAAMEPLVGSMLESYKAEKLRTTHQGQPWTSHARGIPPPKDAYIMTRLIRAMKGDVLAAQPEHKILMVGHSGWSRYAFTHLLPEVEGGAATQEERLGAYARTVAPLANAGVLCARFEGGMFKEDADAECSPLEPKEYPSAELSKGVATMLSALEDSKEAKLLPADAEAGQWFAAKAAGLKMFAAKAAGLKMIARILTISYSRELGKSFFSWSDKWGKPKSHMVIGPENGVIERADMVTREVQITGYDASNKFRWSEYKFRSDRDFSSFVNRFRALNGWKQ